MGPSELQVSQNRERALARDLGAGAAPDIQIRPAVRAHSLAVLAAKRLERDLQLNLLGEQLLQIDEILRKVGDVQILPFGHQLVLAFVVSVTREATRLAGGFARLLEVRDA